MSSFLRLGFVPLNDAAPLVVAREKGFFAAEGLDVELSREASWATVRDKVAVGALDGAHMLAPMAIAASLGVGGERAPMVAPLSLNLSGSAFTVSKSLAQALKVLDPQASSAGSSRPLAELVKARRELGSAPLTFAVVFPFSTHNYQLRYWLADAGIDPDRDVRLVVVPPPRTAEQLRSGLIDGFCVGAPWGVQAVAQGAGEILAYCSDVWRAAPDKVLGVSQAWADRNPETLQAVLRAVLRAATWADTPANRPELAEMLARPEYIGVPVEVVAKLLTDDPQGLIYHRYAAAFPWRSHAVWFLSQMVRWGQAPASPELVGAAREVYRPELYRTAAEAVGQAAPSVDDKLEGAHAEAWALDGIALSADRFCDGRVFDPADPLGYAAGFAIRRS